MCGNLNFYRLNSLLIGPIEQARGQKFIVFHSVYVIYCHNVINIVNNRFSMIDIFREIITLNKFSLIIQAVEMYELTKAERSKILRLCLKQLLQAMNFTTTCFVI